MAVRQQQRRGTAAQWTSANPILSAGEIGFEIDTNKFKIGDGTTRWASLIYFTADAAAALEGLIDGAPGLLDTLNELAAAIGDDANFFTTIASDIDSAKSEAISTAASDATTKANNAKSGAETTAANALSAHESDTTNIHGIADTSVLVTQTDLTNAISGATVDQSALAGIGIDWNSITEAFDIDSTVATKTYADGKASDAESAAISAAATDATTKANNAKSGAEATAASALSAHESDTTNIHGIADTAALATKTYADGAVSTAVAALTKSSVGLSNVDNTSDADKPVSTATQAALDLKLDAASIIDGGGV